MPDDAVTAGLRATRKRRSELAFLPAALEIMETPPSPIGRSISLTIMALFSGAILWASLGSVDIYATAPGRIVPVGGVKTVQPMEAGTVRAIHVRNGESVRAGAPLIDLDPTMSAADVEHVRSDLTAARLDVARLRALLDDDRAVDELTKTAPPEATRAELALRTDFLASQRREIDSRLAELDRQMEQNSAQRATVTETISKLEATVTPLEQRVEVRKYLVDKQIGSKITYLTDYQQLLDHRHEIAVQESKRREMEANIRLLQQTRTRVMAEYRRTLYDELVKAEQKGAGLAQDLVKAERRAQLQTLTAPVDGVVQQLAVHTLGGVVTPGQALAVVVPAGAPIEIEATVSNSDIGFVLPGQDAAIKVETFNFTRFGLLQGHVMTVSKDAIIRDRKTDSATGDSDKGDRANQTPVYEARVSLDQTSMMIDGSLVALQPGMAVNVEVKTGQRRIISYLLSPVLRYREDVLRER